MDLDDLLEEFKDDVKREYMSKNNWDDVSSTSK